MSASASPPPTTPGLSDVSDSHADALDASDSGTPWTFPPRSGYIQPTAQTTTPPNRSTVMPQDTPIHYKSIAAKVHAAANSVVRDKEYIEIGRDMYEHIVGPVPANVILSDVMTVQSEVASVQLRRIGKIKKEKDLVRFFKANSSAFPSLRLRDSHKKSTRTPYSDTLRLPDWMLCTSDGKMEVPGELKPRVSDDPFCDPPTGADGDADRSNHLFLKETEAAMMIVGQLVAYAALMFEVQPRTHAYSFFVCGQTGRLLRWDRAGCIVSESFDISGADNYLSQFFLRYHLMNSEERGHDPSVRFDVSDAEKAKAKELFGQEEGVLEGECDEENFRRVIFPDDSAKDGQGVPLLRQFIVTKPRYFSESVEGAATRGAMAMYIDGPVATWKVTYLKDTHRYDGLDDGCTLEKEGETYERLHAAGVRAIPEHVCSGDALGSFQRTLTDRYLRYACAGVTLFGRRHYYTALGEIGRPLTMFTSMKQLVSVMMDVIAAHMDAYTKAKILHRDISPSNILITKNGGMLIDWQFAKEVQTDDDRRPRMEWRVGTWQFYSYALHSQDSKPTHDLRDDLESFMWVFLYMLVRYRPLNLDPTTTLWYLFTTFDVSLSYTTGEGAGRTRYYGGDKKLGFLRQDKNSFGRHQIYTTLPVPVRALVGALQDLFGPLYPIGSAEIEVPERAAPLPVQQKIKVPKEVYRGKGYTAREIEFAKAEWIRTHAQDLQVATQITTPAPPPVQVKPPPIDYTPVETHEKIHGLFEDARESEEWDYGYDGEAEDQVPKLQRAFIKMQPNAAQVAPTDLSSQRSSRRSSKLKRAAETNSADEPSSKKRKTDSPSTTSLVTRSSTLAYEAMDKLPISAEKDNDVGQDMKDFAAQLRAKLKEDEEVEKAGNKVWQAYRYPDLTPPSSDGEEHVASAVEQQEEEEGNDDSDSDDEDFHP
ncbi:unnamed protein product [Peniophora sp. CBMAI 1063]|nr:unnamed protein product [Peniophora sp. CBMAI 1063]